MVINTLLGAKSSYNCSHPNQTAIVVTLIETVTIKSLIPQRQPDCVTRLATYLRQRSSTLNPTLQPLKTLDRL